MARAGSSEVSCWRDRCARLVGSFGLSIICSIWLSRQLSQESPEYLYSAQHASSKIRGMPWQRHSQAQVLKWPKNVPGLAKWSFLCPQSVQTVLQGKHPALWDDCYSGGIAQPLPWQPSICEHGPLLCRLEESWRRSQGLKLWGLIHLQTALGEPREMRVGPNKCVLT